jgi:hypothetical protein
MVVRYVAAFILSVLMLFLGRMTATSSPRNYEIKTDHISLSHETVTESFGEEPRLFLKVSSDEGLSPVVYYSRRLDGPYHTEAMSPVDSGFVATLPVLEKNNRWWYRIMVFGQGKLLAVFPYGEDQFIKFKGHVMPVVLIAHIVFMYATMLAGALTLFSAIDIILGKGNVRQSVRYVMWTLILGVIGGFIFGPLVSYQTLGIPYEGIPFDNDITDSKTLIFMLFWAFTFFISRRGLKGEKMAVADGAYGLLVILSFIVTFGLFLIPHSI